MTDKTYIKMCETAEEIQALRTVPLLGDLWWSPHWEQAALFTGRAFEFFEDEGNGLNYDSHRFQQSHYQTFLWLPYQHQLQDMLDDWALHPKIVEFHYFYEPEVACVHDDDYGCGICTTKGNAVRHTFVTMEQLWLAFVMEEKYSKVWNGIDWEDKQ